MTTPDWTALATRVIAQTPHTEACETVRLASLDYETVIVLASGRYVLTPRCTCDWPKRLAAKLGRGIAVAVQKCYGFSDESPSRAFAAAARAFEEAP